MASIPYEKARFLLSAPTLAQLPPDEGYEVAFVGRSNAGKSSVLNRLTQNASLARVSKTPGRTQLINLFSLDDQRRLVDLPGYGYAKVPEAIKAQWEKTLDAYFRQRICLKGLILVMDSRHPLKPFDHQMIEWALSNGFAIHLLLNKIDKLNRSEIKKTLLFVEKALEGYSEELSFQLFSAEKGEGMDTLKEILNKWFSG